MRLKLLDLNIEWGGVLIEKVIEYVKNNDFDILTFQEVAGGVLNKNNLDSFEIIKERLSYNGILNTSWKAKEDPSSYFGNAIFYKQNFIAENSKDLWLKDYEEFSDYKNRTVESDPRSALFVLFQNEDKPFYVITSHLAWGPSPYDENYKLQQAEKLYDYLKNLKLPFILAGDFNLIPGSRVIKWMERLGKNLTMEKKIVNTLNPRLNRHKHLFPPGLPVDYIFVSNDIKVENFYVEDKIDLSDHYGLVLEFEV